MDEELLEAAERYARTRRITLHERLGFGIHGIVFAAEDNSKPGFLAVKLHREQAPFEREYRTYQRLKEKRIIRIVGLNVPQLLRVDQQWMAIEMTIVRRPFLLDFAGAWLDEAPFFTQDVIEQWEKEKEEIFGERWPRVTEALAALRTHGIYLLDINPANITFE